MNNNNNNNNNNNKDTMFYTPVSAKKSNQKFSIKSTLNNNSFALLAVIYLSRVQVYVFNLSFYSYSCVYRDTEDMPDSN